MARLVSIHAHPDDAEILAGGTLALLAAGGHSIAIVTMSPGDGGSAVLGPEQTAVLRRGEAMAAADVIGAEYRCAEFRDLAIFNEDASRRRVVELLRSLRPDIVLTASPVDYHPDHEATSVLVRDACFAAAVPNYLTSAESPVRALPAIPHLYFMDSMDDVEHDETPQRPDFYVDVEATFAKKQAMLAQHASQRDWLRKHHGIGDYMAVVEKWTRARGSAAHVSFAEGFRRFKGRPYPQSPILEQLLGGKVIVPRPYVAGPEYVPEPG